MDYIEFRNVFKIYASGETKVTALENVELATEICHKALNLKETLISVGLEDRLYNLSNVNISERKRELASIKVLGFTDIEIYKYVSKKASF